HVRVSLDHPVDVHVRECGPLVVHADPRDHLEGADGGGGSAATVGLDETDHHVVAIVAAVAALTEHGKGLPRSGRGSQVHLEPASRRGCLAHCNRYCRRASLMSGDIIKLHATSPCDAVQPSRARRSAVKVGSDHLAHLARMRGIRCPAANTVWADSILTRPTAM